MSSARNNSGVGPAAELYTWKEEQTGSKGSGPLDAVGVQVDISDLSYSVFMDGVEKKLLQHVSFHLEPGDMCALMGASGAGKRFDICIRITVLMITQYPFRFNR